LTNFVIQWTEISIFIHIVTFWLAEVWI